MERFGSWLIFRFLIRLGGGVRGVGLCRIDDGVLEGGVVLRFGSWFILRFWVRLDGGVLGVGLLLGLREEGGVEGSSCLW